MTHKRHSFGVGQLLRWIAVPLAVVVAWYAALFAGLLATSLLDYFCPPDLMVSGFCIAWWHSYAMDALMALFAAIAAFLIVLSAALVAPSHKLPVARVTYILGCVFAVYAVSQTSEFVAFFAAVLAGLVAVLYVATFGRSPAQARPMPQP